MVTEATSFRLRIASSTQACQHTRTATSASQHGGTDAPQRERASSRATIGWCAQFGFSILTGLAPVGACGVRGSRGAAASACSTIITTPERDVLSFIAGPSFVARPGDRRSTVVVVGDVKVWSHPRQSIAAPLVLVVCLQHVAVAGIAVDRSNKVPDLWR